MRYERSHKAEAALAKKDHGDLNDEADGSCVVDHEGDELLCFENGFDLAMKLVQMSALSKYSGKDLQVFYAGVPSDQESYVFFVAADEDEVVARIASVPDA